MFGALSKVVIDYFFLAKYFLPEILKQNLFKNSFEDMRNMKSY